MTNEKLQEELDDIVRKYRENKERKKNLENVDRQFSINV